MLLWMPKTIESYEFFAWCDCILKCILHFCSFLTILVSSMDVALWSIKICIGTRVSHLLFGTYCLLFHQQTVLLCGTALYFLISYCSLWIVYGHLSYQTSWSHITLRSFWKETFTCWEGIVLLSASQLYDLHSGFHEPLLQLTHGQAPH